MKKFTFLMTFLVCASMLFAQSRQVENVNAIPFDKNNLNINLMNEKAVGDTLFYFDGYYIYVVNPADAAMFDITTEELTGFNLAPQMAAGGWQAGWLNIYDPTTAAPDTLWWMGSSSWFSPEGQANAWIYFGPVTIPATGGQLKWKHRIPDNNYSDGYKVFMSTTGMTYFDFVGSTPVFNRPDNAPTAVQDTNWTQKTIDIPSMYAGQQAYFGFQHDANDQFILYLDDFVVVEANNVGIANVNANVIVSQNFPNPVSVTSDFSYQLVNNADVTIEIFDITGRLLVSNASQRNAGTHTYTIDATNLPNGTYFYTLTAGEFKTTKKFVVVK